MFFSANSKKFIRKKLLRYRRSLSNDYILLASSSICHFAQGFLYSLSYHDKSSYIALYIDFDNEVKTGELISSLVSVGQKVCVPYIVDPLGIMEFRSYTPGEQLEKTPFSKLLQPKEGAIVHPKIIIAPLTGCDKSGNRLGYGRGFYDRYVSNIPQGLASLYLGLAFKWQVVENVFADAGDVKMNYYITEDGLHKPKL